MDKTGQTRQLPMASAGKDHRVRQLFPVNARTPKQSRSVRSRAKIAAAAVQVIADVGLAGLTHRLVAREAGVSLALTTYHHATKFDIIAEASNTILLDYLADMRRVRDRCREDPQGSESLWQFSTRLITNVADHHQPQARVWAEILLDAARNTETSALARDWFAELTAIWTDIAEVTGAADTHEEARIAIDLVAGLYFITLALGLTREEADCVLRAGDDPMQHWQRIRPAATIPPAPAGDKARQTRERIVDAAIALLTAEGPSAISFRRIADEADLTTSAIRYYFRDISLLLSAAQIKLFDACKARCQTALDDIDLAEVSEEMMARLTAAIFMREITEYGKANLASYAIWIEAGRRPEIRPLIWDSIADMCAGWNRMLTKLLGRPAPCAALIAQAIFIGKMVRIAASGTRTACLAHVPDEFARDLALDRLRTFDTPEP